MIDAARSLGLTPWQTWWRVNLPLARPAIAAGVLLALMETIADYGASAYFGLQTFTTSIYRAWFSLGDRTAASQLAAMLLVLVLVLFYVEHRARGRARFFTPTASQRPAPRSPLHGRGAAGAFALCASSVALGFAIPLVAARAPAAARVVHARLVALRQLGDEHALHRRGGRADRARGRARARLHGARRDAGQAGARSCARP